MRTFQSQSQAAQRGATSRPNGGGGGSVSPFSPANIILISALLILTIPVCYSAPAEARKIMTDELFSEIGAACSSYLSEDLTVQVTDALGELCVLMLVQKSKELPVRENSKRPAKLFYTHDNTECLHSTSEKENCNPPVTPSPASRPPTPYQTRERTRDAH